MTSTFCEEPILPAEFPLPKPVSVRTAVIDRDGSTCRLCGDRVGPDAPLVNCRPGAGAGEFPELQMVLACQLCAADVVLMRPGALADIDRRPRFERLLSQLLKLLYLENCQIAQTLPLRAVKS